jgi:hypothetical protein
MPMRSTTPAGSLDRTTVATCPSNWPMMSIHCSVAGNEDWLGRHGIAQRIEHPPGIFEFFGDAQHQHVVGGTRALGRGGGSRRIERRHSGLARAANGEGSGSYARRDLAADDSVALEVAERKPRAGEKSVRAALGETTRLAA